MTWRYGYHTLESPSTISSGGDKYLYDANYGHTQNNTAIHIPIEDNHYHNIEENRGRSKVVGRNIWGALTGAVQVGNRVRVEGKPKELEATISYDFKIFSKVLGFNGTAVSRIMIFILRDGKNFPHTSSPDVLDHKQVGYAQDAGIFDINNESASGTASETLSVEPDNLSEGEILRIGLGLDTGTSPGTISPSIISKADIMDDGDDDPDKNDEYARYSSIHLTME